MVVSFIRKKLVSHVRIACMKSITFSFRMLDLDGQSHYDCATKAYSFVNEVNTAELNVTNSIAEGDQSQKLVAILFHTLWNGERSYRSLCGSP